MIGGNTTEGLEKRHIIFRSQGGLDFPLNFKYLTIEQHKGNNGPHLCRATDRRYKKELQIELFKALNKKYYTEDELIQVLELKPVQAHKICKTFTVHKEGYAKEDIIRRLMGGKLYE